LKDGLNQKLNLMKAKDQIKSILEKKFAKKHCHAAVKHYEDAVHKFQGLDWEGSLSKTGKFVEATLKCLLLYCRETLPMARDFKVSKCVKKLEQLSSSSFSDSIRLTIPRACIFIYDVACNRGARHDPTEIDPNVMDATGVLPVTTWILSELIRIADTGSTSPEKTMAIVNELLTKKYPYSENINGRTYINLEGLSASDTGLLILNAAYPNRILRQDLIDQIKRHGHTGNAAAIAVSRLIRLVDDEAGNLKLRGLGRQEAEKVRAKLS